MEISKIIKNCKIKEIYGDFNGIDIKKLCCDTSEVTENSMFFCLEGSTLDGHNFAQSAVNNGASVLVCERKLEIDIPQIIVDSTRKTMAQFASNFYGNPKEKLKIIGVTGTNGKTTTTYIIKSILENAGKKVGLIGTIGVVISDCDLPATLTTPDPINLHQIFATMVKNEVEYVVMEVSAHAIYYNKIFGINFEVGVLTNVTQDHLDFFGNFEAYLNTKKDFFNKKFCKINILNIDDYAGKEVYLSNQKKKELNIFCYGLKNPSDLFAFDIEYFVDKTKCVFNIDDNLIKIETKLVGQFNVYNAMAAAACCYCLGVDIDCIKISLKNMLPVPGRINVLPWSNNRAFVIDYAHTPDGLLNILSTVKSITKGKLICVFGCGGNRDALKRPIMGKIAMQNSDFTIITSDNPRFENPVKIMGQIEEGAKSIGLQYLCIENREKAIKTAAKMLKSGDVAVICGKGVENYLDIKGEKIPYCDFDVVKSIIKSENKING